MGAHRERHHESHVAGWRSVYEARLRSWLWIKLYELFISLVFFGAIVASAIAVIYLALKLPGEVPKEMRPGAGATWEAWLTAIAIYVGYVVFALLSGRVLYGDAMDLVMPAQVFEGEVTKFEEVQVGGSHGGYGQYVITCGATQFRIPRLDASWLSASAKPGTKVRIRHLWCSKDILEFEVFEP